MWHDTQKRSSSSSKRGGWELGSDTQNRFNFFFFFRKQVRGRIFVSYKRRVYAKKIMFDWNATRLILWRRCGCRVGNLMKYDEPGLCIGRLFTILFLWWRSFDWSDDDGHICAMMINSCVWRGEAMTTSETRGGWRAANVAKDNLVNFNSLWMVNFYSG